MDQTTHSDPSVSAAIATTPATDRSVSTSILSRTEAFAGNNERSAVVLTLFGPSVGPCAGDFSTSYNRVNGRLYAATRAILFYSNLFGFERRLCLQFSDVECVEAFRSTSIKVSTVDCEEHVFRKFVNRDDVLRLLKELYEEATGSDIVRRLPMSEIGGEGLTGGNGFLVDEDSLDDPLRRRLPSTHSDTNVAFEASARDHLRQRSQSLPTMETLVAVQMERKQRFGTPSTDTKIVRRYASSGRGSSTTARMPEDLIAMHLEGGMPMVSFEMFCDTQAPEGFDLDSAWSQAKQPYAEVAMDKISLPCSIEGFIDLFVSDSASFPISKYQKEQIMDKDVSYTAWKKRQDDSCPPVFDRDISFVHPLNNTVGPSQAKTNREQCFQHFGSLGATLQNTTTVKGVPGADCFKIEDKWIVESMEENTVNLTVYFQIIFSKRTMFKSMIQKNVKAETKKWFVGYLQFLKLALREDGKKERPPSPNAASELETEAPESVVIVDSMSGSPRFGWFAACFFLLLFCVVLLQLLHLRGTIDALQSQLVTIQKENSEIHGLLEQLISKNLQQCNNYSPY